MWLNFPCRGTIASQRSSGCSVTLSGLQAKLVILQAVLRRLAHEHSLLLISTAVRQHVVWAAAEVEVREGRWEVQAVPKHFLDCFLCNPCAVNNVNSRVYIARKCQEGFLLASSNNRSCL